MERTTPATQPVDLSNCEREPIHIPGAIQPHGALLAFTPDAVLAIQSANASSLLESPLAVGHSLQTAALEPSIQTAIASALASREATIDPTTLTLDGRCFDVVFHRTDGLLIAEFEPHAPDAPRIELFALKAQRAIERIQRQRSIQELLETATAEIRRLTGFDRVMAYRFRHDDSGDVVVDDRREDLESFLGQRYPAGDIPPQARRLYTLNLLRLIADVTYEPAPLVPEINPVTGRPVDLSHSVLRSVSPIHVEYLTNMGVAASMSISIVVQGRLWGLFACHHMTPRLVPHAIRMSCQVLSQVVSALIERTLADERTRAVSASVERRTAIVSRLKSSGELFRGLVTGEPTLASLIACDGFAVALERQVEVLGTRLPREAVARLVERLDSRDVPDVFYSNRLSLDAPDLKQALPEFSGLLAIRFYREQSGYLFWFRKEQVETVRWGSDPRKHYRTGQMGIRLTPSGSLAQWIEEVRGQSVPWADSEIEIATRLRRELQEVALAKVTEHERARQILMASLGHDLRDPLQAIMMVGKLMEVGAAPSQILSERISASGGRMNRMISQVLDASRLQNGLAFELAVRDVDVDKLVRDAVAEAQTAYPGIEVVLESHGVGTVALDPDRVSQVIANLIGNARHHGHVAKPIRVEATRTGHALVIAVTNAGPEIPEALRDRLFEPFKAASNSNRRNPGGIGLGLYIVHEIMKAHGGSIEVGSGNGITTFRAIFPLDRSAAQNAV